MSNIWAIYKREMQSYFFSPLAYVLYVFFLFLTAVFFYMYFSSYVKWSQEYMQMMQFQQGFGSQPLPNYTQIVLQGITNVMTFILLFVAPMLSMRIIAEEKKMGTIELLFTYPIKDIEILLGKYLSAMTVYVGMLALTFIYVLLSLKVVPDQTYLPAVMTSYLGVFLVGSAFISFGIFASSLTDNQVVAGLITFATLLVLWMIGFVDEINPGILGDICNNISVYAHFDDFGKGVIDTGHAAFYVLFTIFFLFFSLRVLESNRWRG
jgi:gliding motility-associated transport system permease protein